MNIYELHEPVFGVLAPFENIFSFWAVLPPISCSFCFMWFIYLHMRSGFDGFGPVHPSFYELYEGL